MKFVINDISIELEDYNTLRSFENEFPICRDIVSFLDTWFDPLLASIEFKTSGSTGVPKVINHLKSAMIESAKITERAFKYKQNDNALLCLPVKYISGSMMVVRSIVSNLHLYISNLSVNPINKVNVDSNTFFTFAPMTPIQFENLIKINKNLLDQFDSILLGGAPVNDKLVMQLQDIKPVVFIGYGMTETITHLALKKLNNRPDQNYRVLDGFSISKSENDRLIIDGDHLSEQIKTNDIIDLISPKEFRWKGRADNIINSGGIKVNPFDLEKSIGKHVKELFFISSVENEKLGHIVVIVIERNLFVNEEDKENYIKDLKCIFEIESIGNIRPRELYCIDEFILTGSGKIDRLNTLELIKKKRPFRL